jgi:hypothetical protein
VTEFDVAHPSALTAREFRILGRDLLQCASAHPEIQMAKLSTSAPVEADERPHLVLDISVDGGFTLATAIARDVNRRRRELEGGLKLPEGAAVVVPHWDVTADGQP